MEPSLLTTPMAAGVAEVRPFPPILGGNYCTFEQKREKPQFYKLVELDIIIIVTPKNEFLEYALESLPSI